MNDIRVKKKIEPRALMTPLSVNRALQYWVAHGLRTSFLA